MDDDEIEVIPIKDVETAFAGHAGYPICEVWLTPTTGPTVALRLSLETARKLQTKLTEAIEVLAQRSTN